jgi:hypothetical protein
MDDLEILYKLDQYPETYWVLYDLCLLNGWAFIDAVILDWYIFGTGGTSANSDHSKINGQNHSSIHWSRVGKLCRVGKLYRSSIGLEIYSTFGL